MYPIGLVPVGFCLVRSRSVTVGQSRSVAVGQSRSIPMVEVGFSYNNLSLDICLEQYVD